MTLDDIMDKISSQVKCPAFLCNDSHFYVGWSNETGFSATIYNGLYYLTLTKKEPREATYGLTTIAFTGLDEQMVEPALEFLIERLKELI